MKNSQITTENQTGMEQFKKKFTLSEKHKNILCLIVASPVLAILVIAGLCKAYDTYMQNQLETSLNANVKAVVDVQKACDASYNALLQYKKENKLAIVGTGNPCSF